MTPRPAPLRGIPLPCEHGAWVMLYAPLLTGLVVYNCCGPPSWSLPSTCGPWFFVPQSELPAPQALRQAPARATFATWKYSPDRVVL